MRKDTAVLLTPAQEAAFKAKFQATFDAAMQHLDDNAGKFPADIKAEVKISHTGGAIEFSTFENSKALAAIARARLTLGLT